MGYAIFGLATTMIRGLEKFVVDVKHDVEHFSRAKRLLTSVNMSFHD